MPTGLEVLNISRKKAPRDPGADEHHAEIWELAEVDDNEVVMYWGSDNTREELDPGDEEMWFGKHRGMKYDELPKSYINWLVNDFLKDPDAASLNVSIEQIH